MTDLPRIGLAVIARDEEKQLPTLLASVEGAFDQVVLVDTGSTDRTLDVFREWAQAEADRAPDDRLFEWVAGEIPWADDFAMPRNYADSLFSPDIEWASWSDCDDIVTGAQNLRQLAANAPPDLAAYVCNYNYAQDEHGNCVCTLKRERLVRRGQGGGWEGRVHEAQHPTGPVALVGPDVVEWVHRKPPAALSRRNLRILQSWVKVEPDNPRVVGYLGTEHLARGHHRQAVKWFRRYLKLDTAWDQERAQIHRKLSQALLDLDETGQAIQAAFDALQLIPAWTDSYLTLAEAHYKLGQYDRAAEWSQEAIRRGQPDTLLIINPLDYTVHPRAMLAGSLAALGQLDEACQLAEETLQIAPHNGLAVGYRDWRAQRKREHTARAFLAAADTLIEHDEQLKALKVLESVPHYAIEHPAIVDARSRLRERLNPLFDPAGYHDRYVTGGSKVEDMIGDDQVLELGDALPRCAFLAAGLEEQLQEAA